MRHIAFKKFNLGDPKGCLLFSTCRCLFANLCNYNAQFFKGCPKMNHNTDLLFKNSYCFSITIQENPSGC